MKRLFAIIIFSLCAVSGLRAQSDVIVNGNVKDSEGNPVIGAVVMLDGHSSVGAITDVDGTYSIVIPEDKIAKASLTVTCLGYETQTEQLGGKAVVNFILEDDSEQLEEVVVVGYGAMRRSDLTGSVTSVKIDDEDADRATSIDELLKGKAAGVQIVGNSASPDAGVSVRIRGVTSLNGTNEPLYVVDGVILSSPSNPSLFTQGNHTSGSDEEVNAMMGINPQDIASMEILKDASATAIYGSAGANGVVLITTKSASRDKPVIRFNAGVDISQAYKKIDMLNFDEYVSFVQDMDGSIDRMYEGGVVSEETRKVNPIDWQDYLLRNAVSQRYFMSVSGRPKTMSYNFSMGYSRKDGIVQQTGAEQYTIRLNVTKNLYKNFKIGTKSNLSYVSSSMTQGMNTTRLDAATSMMRSMLVSRPYMKMESDLEEEEETDDYDEFRSTPARWLADFQSLRKEYRITPYVFAEWKIFKWLEFKSSFGGDFRLRERTKWKGETVNSGPEGSTSAISSQTNYRWNWDNTLNFNKKIKKHRINATLGMTTSRSQDATDVIEGWNIPEYMAQYKNINSAINTRLAYTEAAVSEHSYFARGMYNYANRYLVTATCRVDGSSKFSRANRYSVFPSFALAWRLSEENWFNADWVSMAKIRLGWGQVGNSGVSAYQIYSTYATAYYPDHTLGNDAEYLVGVVPNNIANPDLKWETTRQWNAGIDLGFWDGRLALTADIYDKNTFDLLQKKTVSTSSGFSSIWVNDGSIQNRGLEIAVDATPVIFGDFEWNIAGNISFNRNRITSLGAYGNGGEIFLSPDNVQQCDYFYGAKIGNANYLNSVVNIFIEGQPAGLFYGYKTDGIVQEGETGIPITSGSELRGPGSINYCDLNDNGYLDEGDKTIVGNPNPDFTYGFSTALSWRGLSLRASFDGSYGNEVTNANLIQETKVVKTTSSYSNIRREAYFQAWTPENPSEKYPALGKAMGAEELKYMTDRWVEDGSFLRVSSVSLSYKLPIPKNKVVQNVTLGVSGRNLYVFTKYSGWDPEVNSYGSSMSRIGVDFGSYPTARTYCFDLKFTF